MNKEQNAALESERVAYEQACRERAARNGRVYEHHYFKRSAGVGEYLNPSAEHGWQVWQDARTQLAAPAGVSADLRELLGMLVIDDERRIKHAGSWRQELHKRATELLSAPSPAPASDVVQVPRELQDEAERCAFVLENIGSMDAEDIDGDAIDLRFEAADGRDTGCDVSIVEYAERAANVIRALLNGGRV